MSDTLRNLVDALNKTNWSSWQTTAGFSAQLEAAERELAAQRVREAAQDLLTALRHILMHIGPGREDGVEWVCEPIHSEEIKAAREAVAKATGEQA